MRKARKKASVPCDILAVIGPLHPDVNQLSCNGLRGAWCTEVLMLGPKTGPRLVVSLESAALLPGLGIGETVDLSHLADRVIEGGAEGVMIHLTSDHGLISEDDLARVADVCGERQRDFCLRVTTAFDHVERARRLKADRIYLGREAKVAQWTSTSLFLKSHIGHIQKVQKTLKDSDCALFVTLEPTLEAAEQALRYGLFTVELDMSHLAASLHSPDIDRAFDALSHVLSLGRYLNRHGVEVHLGGGLRPADLRVLARSGSFRQFNIGRRLMPEALNEGLSAAVKTLRERMSGAGRGEDTPAERHRRLTERVAGMGDIRLKEGLERFCREALPRLEDPQLYAAERLLAGPLVRLEALVFAANLPASFAGIMLIKYLRQTQAPGRSGTPLRRAG
jgi:pyridoxine 5'-phosphate synthase PdxJ